MKNLLVYLIVLVTFLECSPIKKRTKLVRSMAESACNYFIENTSDVGALKEDTLEIMLGASLGSAMVEYESELKELNLDMQK